MRYTRPSTVLALCLALIGLSNLRPADAQSGPDPSAAAAQAFASGLCAADGAAVQAVVTPELWARLQPSFGNAQPGSFGHMQIIHAHQMINMSGYTVVSMLWRHPDGVEDVVLLTLKDVGGSWRVCGGPTNRTAATPLQD